MRGSVLVIVLVLVGLTVLLCVVLFLSSGSHEDAPDEGPVPVATATKTPARVAISAKTPSHVAALAGLPDRVVDTLPMRLPPQGSTALPTALSAQLQTARASGQAADWRAVADLAVKQRCHAVAEDAYRREAAIYQKTDVQAAEAETLKAEAQKATMTVCWARDVDPDDARRLDTHARLEPPVGCYIGAFIDRDDSLAGPMLDSQMHGDPHAFDTLLGRPHASYFTYLSYGMPFPSAWVQSLKAAHAIPHISWEPKALSTVRDDDYLQGFVQAAKAADYPIFIRFAGEMNGDWTPYHADPKAYIKAFRTVYTAFRKAPKAALIWCPNAIPRAKIDDYYPGDDFTDWVGVNFYSVLYIDDDKTRPGDAIHPTDMLDPIYRKYSGRKPIAIGEYAATHQSHLDPKPVPQFAVRRIAELYQALLTQYPRVKLIDWYDCNNMLHARAGRRLNDYLLTDSAPVLKAYRTAVAPAWFLGQPGSSSPIQYVPLQDGAALGQEVIVRASIRCWTSTPHVYFVWDGRLVHATDDPAAFACRMTSVLPGPHTLRVVAVDEANLPVADRTWHVRVQ